MIVDTSAVIAILQGEQEAAAFAEALAAAERRLMSAGSYLELSIVMLDRRGPMARQAIDAFLAGALIAIIPFDEEQAILARESFLRFGKGRHKAALNFGDCMTYALAKREDLPVLFKRTDFGETDLRAVSLHKEG
jgi:ribonuclease VapC